MSALPIHSLSYIEPMAAKYFNYEDSVHLDEYAEFMHNYRNLLTRRVEESDFKKPKKPVYAPIINRDIYRSQHKQEIDQWENWQSLFDGKWKVQKDGSIMIDSPMTGVIDNMKIFGKGMYSVKDYKVSDLWTYIKFNSEHPLLKEINYDKIVII